MIQGDKPSAYGRTLDAKGRVVEVEFRQCAHCQFSWIYKPGSGRKVGLCLYCNGLLCTKCLKREWYKTSKGCIPFSEGMDSVSKDFIFSEELGIFVRKNDFDAVKEINGLNK